jgi:hypothetical protein
MPDLRDDLERLLHGIVLGHLAKLADYLPGPVKKAGGTKGQLLRAYAEDPLFSMFGLDSPEYVAATLGGGTITSIHRKLGDIYEDCVQAIFGDRLGLTGEQLTYTAQISSGDKNENRTADVYIQFDEVENGVRRQAIRAACDAELHALAPDPKIELIGVGMEVRHCYQTNDSKRTQADEAMARHLLVAGILPLMPLFCNQSAPTIIKRYRSVWVIKQGHESYKMVENFSGFDFYDFMKRNRDDFRKPVIGILRGLKK